MSDISDINNEMLGVKRSLEIDTSKVNKSNEVTESKQIFQKNNEREIENSKQMKDLSNLTDLNLNENFQTKSHIHEGTEIQDNIRNSVKDAKIIIEESMNDINLSNENCNSSKIDNLRDENEYNRILISKSLNLKEKFICHTCSKDISNSIKIITYKTLRVACINCLLSEHVLEDYHVVDKFDFSVFSKNWSAREEFKLLYGVEKFGLDNWTEISSYIKSKPKIPCESHYYNYYLKDLDHPMPVSEDIALLEFKNNNYIYDENKLVENDKREENLRNIVIKNKGSIPDLSNSNKDSLINANRSRSLVKNRNRRDQKNITTAEEIIGYWPKRKEFDVEFLNEAELEISDLEFYEDDTKEERELKLNVLHVYNIHLDERESRKE